MSKPGNTGFRRVWKAFFFSMDGLKAAYEHEAAFRQELFLALILLPLGCYLGNTGMERALLAGSVLLVLVVELLNTGIEATVDRVSFDHHELAKRAKDIGSAAVLVSLINLVVVWGFVIFG